MPNVKNIAGTSSALVTYIENGLDRTCSGEGLGMTRSNTVAKISSSRRWTWIFAVGCLANSLAPSANADPQPPPPPPSPRECYDLWTKLPGQSLTRSGIYCGEDGNSICMMVANTKSSETKCSPSIPPARDEKDRTSDTVPSGVDLSGRINNKGRVLDPVVVPDQCYDLYKQIVTGIGFEKRKTWGGCGPNARSDCEREADKSSNRYECRLVSKPADFPPKVPASKFECWELLYHSGPGSVGGTQGTLCSTNAEDECDGEAGRRNRTALVGRYGCRRK